MTFKEHLDKILLEYVLASGCKAKFIFKVEEYIDITLEEICTVISYCSEFDGVRMLWVKKTLSEILQEVS